MSKLPHKIADARPEKEWWTATELANQTLPDIPHTTRGIDKRGKQLGWREDAKRARRRKGAGGGWEYHWTILPSRARRKLCLDAARKIEAEEPSVDRVDLRAAWEGLTDKQRAKAKLRFDALMSVEAMVTSGVTKDLAARMVGQQPGCSHRSIFNWYERLEGLDRGDWLFALADKPRARRPQARVVVNDAFMDQLKADYLRLEEPSFQSCYRRTVRWAEAEALENLPSAELARRRIDEEVPRITQVFARQGLAGLQRCYPPQIRDKTGLTAMEAVNADCHKIDVFVRWPGSDKVERPQIVVFQDVFSGKVLSWRVDHSPNKVMVMAAWADLIRDVGIPKHCLFDNGREFANKWLTGGAPTRFRFKVREDEPLGALSMVDCKIHWATPGHGQAKPVERTFRDWADEVSKHPAFAGAYVGNRPDAKPENYGSTAVALEEFIAVLDQEIAEMNARPGRQSTTCRGRSFDETFAQSYAENPVRKATATEVRTCLMAQQVLTPHPTHGRIKFQGNMYYAPWCIDVAGQKVVARFDPENLHDGLHIYHLDGRFLGEAPAQETEGFFDMDAAHKLSRKRRAIEKKHRDLLRELAPTGVEDVAEALRALTPDQVARPEAKVVEGRFGDRQVTDRGLPPVQTTPPATEPTEEERAQRAAFLQKLEARQAAKTSPQPADDARRRFTRAYELVQRAEAGLDIGEADAAWLKSYRQSVEWRTHLKLLEMHGEKMLAK
ncbi:MAG: transposase domain-containing protein [Pseudomonadota bacterium]